MRLIDADKLDSYIKEKLGSMAEYELFATMIDNQPTTYDVEEVVKWINDWAFDCEIFGEKKNVITTLNAIDFLRGAVKNE